MRRGNSLQVPPKGATDTSGNCLHRFDETNPSPQGQGQQVNDSSYFSHGHRGPAEAGISVNVWTPGILTGRTKPWRHRAG